MEPTVIFKEISGLRLHPLQKHLGDPQFDSVEWHSFVDSLSGLGAEGIPPLFITKTGLIMDGGRRWRAAKQLGWDEIPCLIRDENEAAAIIVDSLLGQRDMSRGAKVYVALYFLPDFIQSATNRRLSNLRNRVQTTEKPLIFSKSRTGTSSDDAETVDGLCQRFGVSRTEFYRARQVHEIFSKDAALRKEWEPRLLNGEKNLWNILSAIGGAGADQSKREAGVLTGQLELFGSVFSNLPKAARAWKSLESDQRKTVLNEWRKTVQSLPADLRTAMLQTLEEAAA